MQAMHASATMISAAGLSARQLAAPRAPRRSARSASLRVSSQAQATGVSVKIAEVGTATRQGTSRKRNEDRLDVDVEAQVAPAAYAAVFDGHGGAACAEWLESNLATFLSKSWGGSPAAAVARAFRSADARILQPKRGMLGMMGERGIGGSKCGATAAVALIYQDEAGRSVLLTANAGDARVVLGRAGGAAAQLTEDHVPDSEDERIRIEKQNPNPRLPLVRYVGGTWRVGGLLALSRAFGDAYLKGTGQFEGVQAGSDGYSSGFGVVAEPFVARTELAPGDEWVVLASDGLNGNEERGGGGGLDNDKVIALCNKLKGRPCDEIAEQLAAGAVEAGSTDDVTVVVLRLQQ